MPDQAVVRSARTLADISDERVVPVDYLGALIALFMLMVLDRLSYTLGAHLGKARPAFPPLPHHASHRQTLAISPVAPLQWRQDATLRQCLAMSVCQHADSVTRLRRAACSSKYT